MSEDGEPVRSGRSNDTVHNAVTFGVSTAVQIGISSIPVLGKVYDVFLAIQMFVDTVLDPENVGTVLTREALNKTCKHNVDQMSEILTGPDVIAAISSAAKQLNPEITDDELKRQIAIQTSLYHREFIYPPNTCFADFVNPDATGKKLSVSFSGPPTDDCKNTALDYYNAYYSYVDANKTSYEEGEVNDVSKIKEILSAIVKIESANKVNADRQVYTNQFIIVGLLFGTSFTIVLILYLVQVQKEKSK
jgi:hypothetical protein